MSYADRRDSTGRADVVVAETLRVGAATALDLGAYDGTFTQALTAAGVVVTAVDRNPMIDEARRLTVTAANVGDLERVDVVVALSVLHHMADWRAVFVGLRHVARRALIVEVPHREERLRKAAAREELAELESMVSSSATRRIGEAPGVYDSALRRGIYVTPPLVSGTVFSGGGNHARTQQRYGGHFATALGYRPHPGSLNIRLDAPPDLGPPQVEVCPNAQRRYQLWAARLDGVDGHLMIPDRAHPDSVEMLAPVRLRDMGIRDGDQVDVEVIW